MNFFQLAHSIYKKYKSFCIEITHGIFTSKVELKEVKSRFSLKLCVNDNKRKNLIQNVKYFYIMLCDIYKNCNIDTKGMVLYRSIDFPVSLDEIIDNNDYLNHILPFSCSWSKKLVCKNWKHQYLLSIILPRDYPFLSLSHPKIKPMDKSLWIKKKHNNYETVQFKKFMLKDEKYFKIINQGQLEVLLPPCKFKLIKYILEGDIINLVVKPEILDEFETFDMLDEM